jgi:dTDP-4-dehydrorhamnose reductase
MIVIIGKSGQLAQALAKQLQAAGNENFVCLGRDDVDITSFNALLEKLSSYFASSANTASKCKVNAIINASAYTAVDKAEEEITQSTLINATAVKNLALVAKEMNAYFLHISTDYVFSGKQNTPYLPASEYEPINQYGKSKMAGEQAILQAYAHNSAIIRTSWVYSEFGNNFVKSMLRLMNERDTLNIVYDQVGSPTNADTLASVCLDFVSNETTGINHACDLGVTSWFDFAKAIYQFGRQLGLLSKDVEINPILSNAYPTPAKRPHYSVLDTTSTQQSLKHFALPYWQDSLFRTLSLLKQDS